MELYNMVLVAAESPELRIIQSEAYKCLIQRNPGLIHENWGDFYSNVSVDALAEAVYRSMNQEIAGKKINKDTLIVEASAFNPDAMQKDKDYIIREPDGIRIYSPQVHASTAVRADEAYSFVSLVLLEDLFCDEKQGSLQTRYKREVERLRSVLKSVIP